MNKGQAGLYAILALILIAIVVVGIFLFLQLTKKEVPTGTGRTCKSSLDCPSFTYCSYGKCVPEPTKEEIEQKAAETGQKIVGKSCSKNADCSYGMVCEGFILKTCQFRSTAGEGCENDYSCSSGLVCTGGILGLGKTCQLPPSTTTPPTYTAPAIKPACPTCGKVPVLNIPDPLCLATNAFKRSLGACV